MRLKSLILLLIAATTLSSYARGGAIDLSRSNIKIQTAPTHTKATAHLAAEILKEYISKISGAQISILSTAQYPKAGDILIRTVTPDERPDLRASGYEIRTSNGMVEITAQAVGRGSIYGVCELLERYFDVKYWAPGAQSVPQRNRMLIATDIDRIDNPAFEYRQTNGQGDADSMYRYFHRLERPSDLFAANMWVHTFQSLVPMDIYGKSHPEYFAYINGERRPGTQSQLCLTNDALFELVAGKVDSIFKANPNQRVISVSQNDGNFTNCTCDKCKLIDKHEGALSGSIIHFINRLAERFPDREISTLAYTYSVQPPLHVKPRPNVNIMLCDIDCMRELPLTQTISGQEFVAYLEGWSKISNNIFVWDYGINFDNCISPFPNFHVLKPNLELFRKNNATKVFEQVNGSRGVDFSELRSWMLTHLMWDPSRDADSLMREFVWGYYGDAAQPIYDYLNLQRSELVKYGKGLWIYDSPVTHKAGFLNQQLLAQYNSLFDKAEAATASEAELLDRVRLSRLALQYAELEIARTNTGQNPDSLRTKVALFKQRTAQFGITSLNERNNSPAEYCDNYIERYLPRQSRNLAQGATIEWTTPASGRYAVGAETALTDELYGGTSFVESWVGWEGIDAAFVVDMGNAKEFSMVESDFLHQLGQWVFLPRGVKYEVSENGSDFTPFGECYKPENRDGRVLFEKFTVNSPSPVKARYIRVSIEGIKTCPSWHYGIGHKAWFFMDELTVE